MDRKKLSLPPLILLILLLLGQTSTPIEQPVDTEELSLSEDASPKEEQEESQSAEPPQSEPSPQKRTSDQPQNLSAKFPYVRSSFMGRFEFLATFPEGRVVAEDPHIGPLFNTIDASQEKLGLHQLADSFILFFITEGKPPEEMTYKLWGDGLYRILTLEGEIGELPDEWFLGDFHIRERDIDIPLKLIKGDRYTVGTISLINDSGEWFIADFDVNLIHYSSFKEEQKRETGSTVIEIEIGESEAEEG